MDEDFNEDEILDFHELSTLVPPTRSETLIEDGIRYVKKVWDTKYGDVEMIYIYVTSEAEGLDDSVIHSLVTEVMERMGWETTAPNFKRFIKKPTIDEKIDLLELKLEKAVEEENYERAARLRDEIVELNKGNDVPWE